MARIDHLDLISGLSEEDKAARLGFLTPATVQQFVCGFYYDDSRSHVVLIRKQKPAWQKGRLNGVGGKIEQGETPLEAMRREFAEEAGKNVTDWEPLATLHVPLIAPPRGGVVHFFRAFGDFNEIQSMTEERIAVRTIYLVLQDPTLMPNLRFLIMLGLDESGITKPVDLYDEGEQPGG